MPDIEGFHHVNLSVRDLDTSSAWYTKLFGFEEYKRMEDDGSRGAKVVSYHPASGIVLGFTQHQRNTGEQFSEYRTGLDHLAFAVADREALSRWGNRLEELGVPYSVASTGALITIRDPDNIQVQIYSNE